MNAYVTATGLSDAVLVQLARELAMNILPLGDVLERLKLTQDAFERITRMPRFTALVEQMAAEWGSTLNTSERVKVKSQALVEESLPELFHLLHDRKESMAAKVEALKLLKTLGGISERAGNEMPQERFRLEIHIGEAKPQVIDVTPGPQNLKDRELESFTVSLNDGELAGGVE